MSTIENKIKSWTEAKLISSEQATAILDYEESHDSKRSWAASAVAGFGIIVFLTGVISIIASNWEHISSLTKIISYFIIQALLGIAVVRQDSKPGLLREVCISLFAGFMLAGIGLIGQIYNLGGKPWQALAFWLLLSLPVTFRAESRLSPHLWILFFMLSYGLWVFDSQSLEITNRLLSSVAIAFLFLAVGLFRSSYLPLNFRTALRVWAFIFLAAVVTTTANGLWLQDSDSGWLKDVEYKFGIGLIWFTTLIACLSVYLTRANYNKALSKVLCLMLISIASFITLPFFQIVPQNSLTAFLFFQLVWTLVAAAAGLARRRRLFDLATIVITLRFIVVYFEVFGSMAATGAGLIISGALIISAGLVWNKYRVALATYLGARES
jgi:uncharacterized membrane protein